MDSDDRDERQDEEDQDNSDDSSGQMGPTSTGGKPVGDRPSSPGGSSGG